MQVELASAISNDSLNSSLTSVTNTDINENHNKPIKEVKKKLCCNTCKQTAEERERVWFKILLTILYMGYIFVTFLGVSLIFRKPLCYILNGLLQYYTIE